MKYWIILFAAIFFEVCGTTSLKLSQGFSKLWPTVCIFVFYGIGFYLITLTLKRMDLGMVYAIWSGLGTALVVLIGVFYFNDPMSASRCFYLALIIIGVLGLHLSAQTPLD